MKPACVIATATLLVASGWSHRASAQEIQISGPLNAHYRECSPDDVNDACPTRPYPESFAHGTPAPRSASDWYPETPPEGQTRRMLGSGGRDAPIRRDLDSPSPGAFVTERGQYLRAPRLQLRGFEATNGQDAEILYGNIPLNQVSNMRAPGYADLRLIMPEAIRSVRVSSGPYDPHQGDFATGGSVHLEPGIERPGFNAKGTYGSFNTRRLFLGFAPADREWSESFAAFEVYGTDGPGGGSSGFGRGAERTAFIAQVAWGNGERMSFKGTVAIGDARADFPGYLDQRAVEVGLFERAASRFPLGRDRTSQAHVGTDATWRVGRGRLKIGAYASQTKMAFRQNLTGFLRDRRAAAADGVGNLTTPPDADDSEQVNEASTLGLTTAYMREIPFISEDSHFELGTSARVDTIEQTDTRLRQDGTRLTGTGAIRQPTIDASIDATNLAAYLDAFLHPTRRVTIRGGPRLDSLSYLVEDRVSALGVNRTSQGFHLGNKVSIETNLASLTSKSSSSSSPSGTSGAAMVPWLSRSPTNLAAVASYGEGFRSPQARTLREGERVPFATIRSVEAGLRLQRDHVFRTSLAGFASWLSQERVFDADVRENAAAPSSSRFGIAAAAGSRLTVHNTLRFISGTSLTYTRSAFTGSDARFRSGDPVPYVPRLVARGDVALASKLMTISEDEMWWTIGTGIEGAAAGYLPDGSSARNAFFVDARASIEWREIEVGLVGTNLLGLRYFDAQYAYASSFDRAASTSALAPPSPRTNVLVTAPTTVLVTLDIHYPKRARAEER